jgi:hypothetical protein
MVRQAILEASLDAGVPQGRLGCAAMGHESEERPMTGDPAHRVVIEWIGEPVETLADLRERVQCAWGSTKLR